MADEEKVASVAARGVDQSGDPPQKKRGLALWLGGGNGTLDMGWGRGPRRLEGHELVSWFFSRDGH